MKVYILTGSDMDVLEDTSLRDIFRGNLEAPPVFSTPQAARTVAQHDLEALWDAESLGPCPNLEGLWKEDPDCPEVVEAVVVEGVMVFRITEKELE